MHQYRKKSDQSIVAVQIDLETDGLHYRKWGDVQHAKAGDWLVNNGGSVYTIDQETFARTYRQVSQGLYEKVALVYAEPASDDGSIETQEGRTHYTAGDYLVYETPDQTGDAYAVSKQRFEAMYELTD